MSPNRSPRARLAALSPLAILFPLFGCAATPASAQSVAGPAPGAQAPDAPSGAGADEPGAGEVAPEFPREDEPLLAWVEAQIAAIGDVRKIDRDSLLRVYALVDGAMAGAEHHLAQFPESPRRANAELLLARLLFLNVDRYIGDRDQENQRDFNVRLSPQERLALEAGYDARILDLIAAALARQPDLPTLGLLHEVRGELHVRRGRPLEGAKDLEQTRAAYPGHPKLDELHIKLGEAYLNGMDYPRALEIALHALAQYPRSNFWPHYFWFAHKCLRHMGRIEEGIALWEKHLPGLRARAAGEPIAIPGEETPYITPTEYRIDSQRYVDRAGFYSGFFAYALGRVAAARQAFREYSDALHARIAGGETLGMDTLVYLEKQADPMERRISLFEGAPAPELGASLRWGIPPAEEPGVATCRALLFCNSRNAVERQAGFIALLSRLGNEYWPRGLRVEWIGLAAIPKMIEPEGLQMQDVARVHRLGWAMGIDVGPENTAHTAYQVPTGGTVLFVIDTKGEIAWQLIDPMHWDEGLIRRVLERLLPAPAAIPPEKPAAPAPGAAPPAPPPSHGGGDGDRGG